jgi:transposase-like protein
VLVGPGLRRRWSAEEKARIVGESLVLGARWQVCSQQVFGRRRAACQNTKTVATRTTGAAASDFVSITTDAPVRIASGMDDAALLTAVLRAVRASASRT